jgi:muramidase (phage lysozyme)
MTMKEAALLAAASLLVYGAWLYTQPSTDGEETLDVGADWGGDFLGNADQLLTSATQETAQFVDKITMGTFRLSNMAAVTAADLNHPNVQALLRVIRRGEGTADAGGYSRLFGGGTFASYADHPRTKVTRTMRGKPITSSAAGAYQFLSSTWDETARLMRLGNFSPANQDMAAVGRIAARGALDDAKAGRFDVAIKKIAQEWASMPGSPYGQPVISLATARNVFADNGGTIAA